MIIFKFILSRWQHYAHDQKLAETLLHERDKTEHTDATKIEYAEARSLKIDSLIVMGEEQYPCKVNARSIAEPREHSSDQVMITAKDVFTDVQYVGTFLKSDVIARPVITETEGTATSYNNVNGVLKTMMPDGGIREDLKLPSEAHLAQIATRIK